MADDPAATAPESGPAALDALLDKEMGAVFDAMTADDGPADKPEAAPAEKPAAATRERAPDGKFASKATAPDKATAATKPDLAQVAKPETPAPAPPSIEAPQSWSADVKAKWAALPPDLQAYIAKRESDAHQQITQTGDRLKGYSEIDRVIEPHRAMLVSTYGSPARAVETLFNLAGEADRDFVGFALAQSKARGIDLFAELARRGPPGRQDAAPTQTAAHDPRVDQLLADQRIAQERALDAEIAEFAKDKPYFEALRPTMAKLMTGGLAANLPDAYAMAMRADEATHNAVVAEREAKAKAEAEEAAKIRAAEARKHAAINVTTRTRGASPAAPGRWEDTMAAVYDRVHAA